MDGGGGYSLVGGEWTSENKILSDLTFQKRCSGPASVEAPTRVLTRHLSRARHIGHTAPTTGSPTPRLNTRAPFYFIFFLLLFPVTIV